MRLNTASEPALAGPIAGNISALPSRNMKNATLHVLTLTPFYPSLENEVNGCFVKEPLDCLAQSGLVSSVIAVRPIYQVRQHETPAAPARWIRYPQIPGTMGLANAGRFLYARLLREVMHLESKGPIDVIHAHAALPCGHAASLLARRLNIPYIVTVHGLDVFNSCDSAGISAQKRRQASIAAYKDASAVICVSGKVRQILRDGMSGNVASAVVYNGADPEVFSPAFLGGDSTSMPACADRKEILIVGNLIAGKGQELVLRSMHRLVAVIPELQCRIIGEGPDRPRLEALVRELGIRERIHFLGRQSRAAVAEAMRRCSIFVLPSRNEGLGCVYLEAMACAKPVIGCRGQGIEEIIEHEKSGWLIQAHRFDELAHGLSILLQSPELASNIGMAARQKIVSELTIAHQARHCADIYRAAVSDSERLPRH